MRFLAFIGALAIAGGLAAAIFFFGGFFDVSARWEDPAFLKSAIARVREASIVRHATVAPPSSFGDAARVQAGARVFASLGCANCHGAPGVAWKKFSEGMNPAPPDLKEHVVEMTPAQLFFVVKNGIRMTGMPSFGAVGAKDDDLWSLVAFLKKLPSVTDADFKTWTAPPALQAAPAAPAPQPTPSPAEAPKQ